MTKRFILCYDFLTEIGGLERLMVVHAKFLKNAGYRVKLIFGEMNRELATNEIFSGLELEEFGSKKLTGSTKILGGIIGANYLKNIIQPNDTLISYSFPMNITLRKFNNTKIQYLNHFPNFLYLPLRERWIWANNTKRKIAFFYSLILGPITKKLDKKYIDKNSLIFVNSNFTKKKLDPLYDIDATMSYPPVNNTFSRRYNEKTYEKFELPSRYIFASGRIIPDKRYDLLIEGFAKMENKRIPLVISGKWDNKEYTKLNKLAKSLGVANRIYFLGFVTTEELVHIYSAATIYVVPTMQEDFGMCSAESLSCGCPIITWDDEGGSCEQTINRVNGYHAISYITGDLARMMDKCIREEFKLTHHYEILDSAKKFSEEYQENIFIKEIKKVI